MTPIQKLSDITLLAESSDLECKKAVGRDGKGELPKDFWATYSAMANTDGGTVLLGIKETKEGFELSGIEDYDKVQKDLFDTANNPSTVSTNLLGNQDVQVREIEGKHFLQIFIRRASREERPVYLKGNPLGNTYVRRHEGDQRLSNEAVKRMLAEQTQESRDSYILSNYGLDDLNRETLRVYRQMFSNLNPSHPWNELELQPFLEVIGGWKRRDNSTEGGLTAAGLLMFGELHHIYNVFPNYMLDYQERPTGGFEQPWIDRITLDGTWSGNLYDFFRFCYRKLVEGLKVPFVLKDGIRQAETPVHVALREALCNVLVHADFSDRASVRVLKYPNMFEFRNPGMMRISIEEALSGGVADCRNRILHRMFRLVGIGDQSGSGIPKILDGWKKNHWRLPELDDSREPHDHTIMRMRMIDLFPKELVESLHRQYGTEYDSLTHDEQAVMAIAWVEKTVNHRRLLSLLQIHPSDATDILHGLVTKDFLSQTGSSRGAVYHLSGVHIPGPEDVFDNESLGDIGQSLGDIGQSLGDIGQSLGDSESSLGDIASERISRDEKGRIISTSHTLPFIDNLSSLEADFLESLRVISAEPREKRRISKESMESIIIALMDGQFVTLNCLAELTDRRADNLQKQYLRPMVKAGKLEIAFPRTPNDPRQAYTKAAQK